MVNSFLEDYMTDAQGRGTGRPIDNSHFDRGPVVVGCSLPGWHRKAVLTSEGSAC
jgi:hypothetical protein